MTLFAEITIICPHKAWCLFRVLKKQLYDVFLLIWYISIQDYIKRIIVILSIGRWDIALLHHRNIWESNIVDVVNFGSYTQKNIISCWSIVISLYLPRVFTCVKKEVKHLKYSKTNLSWCYHFAILFLFMVCISFLDLIRYRCFCFAGNFFLLDSL